MANIHWTIFADNESDRERLFEQLLSGRNLPEAFDDFQELKGGLLSQSEIARYIEEEERHEHKILTKGIKQPLRTLSSGERKKALLNYLLSQGNQFLVLDNPLDNLDVASRESLIELIHTLSVQIPIIQIVTRRDDKLPFTCRWAVLYQDELKVIEDPEELSAGSDARRYDNPVPAPLEPLVLPAGPLVCFKDVSVSYGIKPVLDEISWELGPGDYWQLSGPNGSGKSTLLSLITGENPKAYGQDITLFGKKKGSGESVWDIKQYVGYFTPAMVDRFRGYHSLENMLISGLHDSIGLYVQPTKVEQRLARSWLSYLGMEGMERKYFHDLSLGQQRLIMCVRAMIKHPPLLILDEPTAGLDDSSAALVVALVNQMAVSSHCCIVFVSHRMEPGLKPRFTYSLVPGKNGSIGSIIPGNP